MKHKMYRIELRKNGGLASELCTLAALSNGTGNYVSIQDLVSVAKTEMIKYTGLNEGITVSLIGDHTLMLDKGTENLLCLTEVEILELDKPEITNEQARDILEDMRDEHPLLN